MNGEAAHALSLMLADARRETGRVLDTHKGEPDRVTSLAIAVQELSWVVGRLVAEATP